MNKSTTDRVRVYYNSKTDKEVYTSPSILAELQQQLENQITVINGEPAIKPWDLIDNTKFLLYTLIKSHGGEIDSSTPFSQYPIILAQILENK